VRQRLEEDDQSAEADQRRDDEEALPPRQVGAPGREQSEQPA